MFFGGKMKLRNFLKVLLTSMLVIFMCFALVGCGGKNKDGNKDGDSSDGEKLYPYTKN